MPKATLSNALSTMTLPFTPVHDPAPNASRDAEKIDPVPTPPITPEKIAAAYAAPTQPSTSNALADNAKTLQTFRLKELEQFTKEQSYSTNASDVVHLFYVGRDDVHDILKYLLSRVSISLYLNMFGFDDSELNNILMTKALDPSVTMLITLDESQAGGVHEKALLAADQQYNLAAYNTHFVIGQSATKQISHTKGFVADGRVAAEGSTNWSDSGEGTFVVVGKAGGPNYKAQNNTQSVITDPDTIVRFQTELITEHMTAAAQANPPGSPQAPALPTPPVKKTPVKTAPTKTPSAKKTPGKKAAAGG